MLKAIEFDSSNRDLHDWNVRLRKHENENERERERKEKENFLSSFLELE